MRGSLKDNEKRILLGAGPYCSPSRLSHTVPPLQARRSFPLVRGVIVGLFFHLGTIALGPSPLLRSCHQGSKPLGRCLHVLVPRVFPILESMTLRGRISLHHHVAFRVVGFLSWPRGLVSSSLYILGSTRPEAPPTYVVRCLVSRTPYMPSFTAGLVHGSWKDQKIQLVELLLCKFPARGFECGPSTWEFKKLKLLRALASSLSPGRRTPPEAAQLCWLPGQRLLPHSSDAAVSHHFHLAPGQNWVPIIIQGKLA